MAVVSLQSGSSSSQLFTDWLNVNAGIHVTIRRTKILCTLGPSSNSKEKVEALVDAGMDCVRLNFSHGTHDDHKRLASLVREVSKEKRKPVAILADLCGPKIRLGTFYEGKAFLRAGEEFVLTSELREGDSSGAQVSYKNLERDLSSGDPVLIDDGLLRLSVNRIEGNNVVCKVEVGGEVSNHKGVNLPGVRLSVPSLTEKDKKDLNFAIEALQVDYLALSFVRSAEDVLDLKRFAKDTPIVSKLEKPEAIENLKSIVKVSDGVMVARGDLGVELGNEKVPLAQKRIIQEANYQGKFVITATQMLDSMIRNPRPTRAEVADVANAVLDGTSAVMLSGETASGKYPIEAVQMMDATVRDVETQWLKEQWEDPELTLLAGDEWEFPSAAAQAAALLASVLPLKAIVTFTQDGHSARLISEHRPRAPIVAITSSLVVARRLALDWGVIPRVEIPPEGLEETLRISSSLLIKEKLCSSGEAFVMVVGWPLSERTNTVKLHRLG